MAIKTGLCSITFRDMTPAQIIDLVAEAGLDGIEWGGDVHVPHGDVALAREVGGMTRGAGLAVSSYGSYYRAVESEEKGLTFAAVLDTTLALGAPLVRVWAGARGSAAADDRYRAAVTGDLRRIGELAATRGVVVSLEFHGNTLTDSNGAAMALLRAVNHPNVTSYWQESGAHGPQERMQGLRQILPHLTYLHVFHWAFTDGAHERRALAEDLETWQRYLAVADSPGKECWALLEFVRDGSAEQFRQDAATLITLVSGAMHKGG